MSGKRIRGHSRSFFRMKIVFVLSCVVLVFVVSAIVREWQRKHAVQQEIQTIEDEVRRLEQQRNRFTDLLEHADSQEVIEREARLRLGLQKPGEEVLIIAQPEAGVGGTDGASRGEARESNVTRWWRHLFH